MQTNYNILYSLTVYHSYFKEGTISNLQFTPDSDTQLLLDRFGLLYSYNNRLELYANTNESLSDFLTYLIQSSGASSFGFNVYTQDPHFYYYTELPLDFAGVMEYSSNNASDQASNEGVLLYPNFSNEQNNVLAKVQIHFSDLKKAIEANNKATFTIYFDARATIWQYYIINSSQMSLDSLQIKTESAIQFSGPEEVTLKNGEKALLFTSNSLLPFSKEPTERFDLIGGSSNSRIIFKGLPASNPAQLSMATINGEQVICSPMYLYV